MKTRSTIRRFRRPEDRAIAAGVAMALILPQTACTMMGAAIGSQVHHPTSRREFAPGEEAVHLDPKLRAVLFLRDGSRVEGLVEAVGLRSEEEYAQAYLRFQVENPRGALLPDLGPARLVRSGESSSKTVAFLGFDQRSVIIRRGTNDPERIGFLSVASLSVGARTADGGLLRDLVASAKPPLNAEVRLAQPRNRIAIDDIASIERPVMAGRAIEGAGIGLLFDGLAVLIAYTALADLKNADWGIRWDPFPE